MTARRDPRRRLVEAALSYPGAILVPEDDVQRGLRHACPLDDSVDADGVDTFFINELARRSQQSLPLLKFTGLMKVFVLQAIGVGLMGETVTPVFGAFASMAPEIKLPVPQSPVGSSLRAVLEPGTVCPNLVSASADAASIGAELAVCA